MRETGGILGLVVQFFIKALGGCRIDNRSHTVDGSPDFTFKGEASFLHRLEWLCGPKVTTEIREQLIQTRDCGHETTSFKADSSDIADPNPILDAIGSLGKLDPP
jgi:hypothetical protein